MDKARSFLIVPSPQSPFQIPWTNGGLRDVFEPSRGLPDNELQPSDCESFVCSVWHANMRASVRFESPDVACGGSASTIGELRGDKNHTTGSACYKFAEHSAVFLNCSIAACIHVYIHAYIHTCMLLLLLLHALASPQGP